MQLVVGRIGRPHGVRGELTVEVRTDSPDTRFAPGSSLSTDPVTAGPLVVDDLRWHSGRLLLTFAGLIQVQFQRSAPTASGASSSRPAACSPCAAGTLPCLTLTAR